MRRLLVLMCVLVGLSASAQEIRCTVTVNAEQTARADLQIFRTLKNQIEEFVNEYQWTNMKMTTQERIDMNLVIIVTDYDGDDFTATLQVQSSRPAYGSSYNSPVYNYNDKQFSFTYREFQPLNFNPNSFDSNLISVIAFHVYTVIGLDADTFSRNGGDPYFQVAKQIVNTAASSNFLGWKATDGAQSRFRYNDALLSNVFSEFHNVMYDYHRLGLDIMHENPKEAKQIMSTSLSRLRMINDRRPNSFLLRTFFDAKENEISRVFSGGPQVDIAKLIEDLNRMAPTKRASWEDIRY
ncbi:DUF4835 family protein [Gilvibacter sp.]|uniref:type IX secretion system protein PorD n=1 Tax=Gilvibacter sp. TaxID=2729997 RepID=UPI003F49BA1C